MDITNYILKVKNKNEFCIEKVLNKKNIFKILEKLIKYLNIHIENQIIMTQMLFRFLIRGLAN